VNSINSNPLAAGGSAARPARQSLAKLVSHGFYPIALGLTFLFIYLEVVGAFGPLGKAYPAYLGVMITTMLVLEWQFPMRPAWSMTWRSLLRRDLPMLVVNGAAIAATTAGMTALAHGYVSGAAKLAHGLPWWGQAMTAILISDFLWYWVHRYSHEGRGRMGQWLWKTHVMHHLPEQVYVFMHGVGHPINSAYVRVILMLPAMALGFSAEGVFAAAVLTGFQGLVSHFNVDVRAGGLNRVFMGTELHRHHHSADPQEGRNYAAVITLWDQLFGTFEYAPGKPPSALGVQDRGAYPEDGQWGALMALPFKGSSSGNSSQ
jgi:sterol desaturase/sphingolipid hydroxylase (fatty acid hydroxylase superfamily)